MNTYIFTDPHFRPRTLGDQAMPNAKLKFFLTTTLTPTPVYADAALDSELGTEVDADGDGVFPVMYMDPEITVRVQLYSEADVLQWDVDPYTPPRDYPPGTTIMFIGTPTARDAAYPPDLWQVCNGDNGSIDIRDRFPVGAGGALDSGDTGGSVPGGGSSTGPAGAHDHGAATGDHALTTAELASHIHPLRVCISGSGSTHNFDGASGIAGDTDTQAYYTKNSGNAGNDLMQGAGSGDPHAHDITGAADHTHSLPDAELPPYVALWFLMRRS